MIAYVDVALMRLKRPGGERYMSVWCGDDMHIGAYTNMGAMNLDVAGLHHSEAVTKGFELWLDKMFCEPMLKPSVKCPCMVRAMIVDHPDRTCSVDVASLPDWRRMFSSIAD